MPRVYCARCGRPNPDGARFCSYCGTQLTAPVPPGSGMPAGSRFPAGPGGTGGYPAGGPPERPGETTSTISLGRTDDDLGDDLYPDSASFGALPPGSALLLVMRGPNAGSRFRLDGELTTAGRQFIFGREAVTWGVAAATNLIQEPIVAVDLAPQRQTVDDVGQGGMASDLEGIDEGLLVLDHEDGGLGHAHVASGSRSVKRDPSPSRDSTLTSPP